MVRLGERYSAYTELMIIPVLSGLRHNVVFLEVYKV
jgi:hypothetical protein